MQVSVEQIGFYQRRIEMVWDKPTKLNQEEVKWSFIICILKIALFC